MPLHEKCIIVRISEQNRIPSSRLQIIDSRDTRLEDTTNRMPGLQLSEQVIKLLQLLF